MFNDVYAGFRLHCDAGGYFRPHIALFFQGLETSDHPGAVVFFGRTTPTADGLLGDNRCILRVGGVFRLVRNVDHVLGNRPLPQRLK
jgi:hypothetical protein